MKYKPLDKVRIKSLDWYNENKDKDGNIFFPLSTMTKAKSEWCGKVMTILSAHVDFYRMEEMELTAINYWTDEMIEGLVEEETKPNVIEEAKTYWDSIKDAWICPDGYIFKDENGNIINATKIVLEKKKTEYPKTYEECEKVLRYDSHRLDNMGVTVRGYKWELIRAFQILLICRDAYWKIAGEEMGLGKPWEPDWDNDEWPDMAYISYDGKSIDKENGFPCCNMILIFPTDEMRDAFYENFKEEIEICKELL